MTESSPFPGAGPSGVDYGSFTLTVKQVVLASLAGSAAHALPAREQVPVLGCFRVSLDEGTLQLAATSGERSVLAATSAVTCTPGQHRAYIPARKLLAILREAPGGDIQVTVKKNEAEIVAGSVSWNLKLPDGTAYPVIPSPEEAQLSPYSRQKLVVAIKGVRHAVCKDAAQPSLTQVAITAGKSSVVTASDRSRLARVPLEEFPIAATIPAPVLDDLVRVLSEHPDETVSIGEAAGHIVVRAGNVTMVISKRAAAFPDMDGQLLAPAIKENTSRLTVDREELEKAVRRVAITADAQTSAIALRLSAKAVTVEARDKNGNSSSEDVHAQWDGKARVVVVNHGYLQEMLSASTAPSCEFLLGPDAGKRLSPLLLSGKDGAVQVLTRMPAALLGY